MGICTLFYEKYELLLCGAIKSSLHLKGEAFCEHLMENMRNNGKKGEEGKDNLRRWRHLACFNLTSARHVQPRIPVRHTL